MKINRNNYEPYFIDYLEGNLDEKLVDDFLEFLQQNPDLKEELSLFNSLNVEPDEVKFTKKELLFREKYDREKEFNKAAVAQMEGDISNSERKNFEKYIQKHPEKQKDILLFQATKLIPDGSIVYGRKNKLYHYSVGRNFMYWSVRIAAILILALTFYILMDNSSNRTIPESQVAKVEDETPKDVKQPEAIQTPQKPEKQDGPEKGKSEKSAQTPVVKKVKPVQEQKKSIRENSKGRISQEDIASIRVPFDIPAQMKTLTASMYLSPIEVKPGTMYITIPIEPQLEEERFLADIVAEKTGLDKLNLRRITKAGLKLVSSVSDEKFQYQTNEDGKIIEYNYDSRLMAFTIPVKNRADEK